MEPQIDLEETIIPLEQSPWMLLAENLVVLAIFVGVFILFKYTKRPGRLGMLTGISIYLLLSLAIIPIMNNGFNYSGISSYFILLWPNMIVASIIVSVIGFLRFAWSFKNEN